MPRQIPASYAPVAAIDVEVRKQHERDSIAADHARQNNQHRRALIERACHPVWQRFRAHIITAEHAILSANSMAAVDEALAALEAEFHASAATLRLGVAAVFDNGA